MSQNAPQTAQRPPQAPNLTRNDQRAPQRETRLQRAPKSDSRFDVDPSLIPDGMSYQWNVDSVMGNTDIARPQAIHMARNHWKPVPARRHPELSGWREGMPGGDAAILIGGQMLCERPSYLTDEARDEDLRNAKNQVGQQIQRLGLAPAGTAPRETADGRTMATAKRDYNLAVPEDAD